MSDLHCPATVMVMRHGDAEYDVMGVASDDGGSLSQRGREQAKALGESLSDERVAAIWCSDLARAVQTAEIVAARLDLPVRVRGGLREYRCGDLAGQPTMPDPFTGVVSAWAGGDLEARVPGAESGAEIVERFTTELDSIADQFRGETVLVVSHGGAMHVGIPTMATNVAQNFLLDVSIDNCTGGVLERDADGWRLVSWNGASLG